MEHSPLVVFFHCCLCSILLCLPGWGMAQLPFQKKILSNENIDVKSLVQTPNGGVIMSGGMGGLSSTQKGFLLRLDPCGDLEWMRTYDIGPSTRVHHAIVTLDGGYIMTGSIQDPFSGRDLIVIKTDGLGNILWQQTFRGTGSEEGFAIDEIRSNGLPQAYIVSGFTSSYGEGADDILLLSLNLQGQINWQRQYGGNENESGARIFHTSSGELVCVGSTNSFGPIGEEHAFVLKLDMNTGNQIWFKVFELGENDLLRGLELAGNGDIIVSGYTDFRQGMAQNDYWIMRLNGQGFPIWSKVYGSNAEERGFEIVSMTSGGFALGGMGVNIGAGQTDYSVLRTDDNGNLLWSMAYGTPDADGDYDRSHYTIGPNLADGLWLGHSTYLPSGQIEPFFVLTDANGQTGGLCQDYPQSLTTLSPMPIVSSPVPAVKAFGFSSPATSTVQAFYPLVQNYCTNIFVDLGPDTLLCPNEQLLLSVPAYPSATYEWSSGDTSQSFLVTQPGTYLLTVWVNACPRQDTVLIDYLPDLNLLPQSYDQICQGDSLFLEVPPNMLNWVWGNGSEDSIISVSSPGVYSLTASDTSCTYQDSFTLNVSSPPVIDLGPDTMICPGNELLLDVFIPSATYLWQDGSFQSDYLVTDSGLYQVELSLAPCLVEDSIHVGLRAVSLPSLGIDTTICEGEVLLLSNPTPGFAALWSDGTNQDSLFAGQAGIYWLETFDGFCLGRDSLELYVLGNDKVDLGLDTIICEGEHLSLNPGFPGTQHIWQDSLLIPAIEVDTAGWYWVQVVAPFCDDSDSIFVALASPPSLTLDPVNIQFCEGDSLFYEINENPLYTYRWDDGLVVSDRWLKEAGWYRLMASDSLCSSEDSVRVQTTALPFFDLGPDTVLCEGESLMLSHSIWAGELLWSDGSTDSLYQTDQGGWVWLEHNLNNCAFRDSLQLDFLPFPEVELGNDTLLCEGQQLSIRLLPEPELSFYWRDGSVNNQFTIRAPGQYWVEVARGLCITRDSIGVQYRASPFLDLGPDTAFCTQDGGIQLKPELPEHLAHFWSDGSTDSDLAVGVAGTYWLSLETESCGLITDTVEIVEYPCQCPLFFPSAFSPNQDGNNETFSAVGVCEPQEFELQIFNRWGRLVFATQDPSATWDGRFQGVICAEGVYVWLSRYRYRDRGGWRNEFQRGTISLLR